MAPGRRSTRAPGAGATRLRLRPADPFELIRWLARSQSDPRKAVAELVQNSLDAQARVVVDAGPCGASVRGEGPRPAVAVDPAAAIGATAVLRVRAAQGARHAEGEARVDVGEDGRDGESLGIPEPHLVSDADGAWRSRMSGGRWEVNDAHEDYRALRADGRSRLRYLLALLAKEIVLRTTGRVETADVMDSMVEVLAHAERNLRGG